MGSEIQMYKAIYSEENLTAAWKQVKSNGLKSPLKKTRDRIRDFNENYLSNLQSIRSKLIDKKYTFSQSEPILKKKSNGESRPIIMASVPDRIVQRAILQVLCKDPAIITYLKTPFSFGGIEGKRTADALINIQERIEKESSHYLKCDIKQFFCDISRKRLNKLLGELIKDKDVLNLLMHALEVQLLDVKNSEVKKHLDLFPDDETGVAQGSCLSPFLANIYLYDLDRSLNGWAGIYAFRFIDDIVILGRSESTILKAYAWIQEYMAKHNLALHDELSSEKLKIGSTDEGIEFLGCRVFKGLIQPTKSNRGKLLNRLDTLIDKALKYNQIAIHDEKSVRGFIDILNFLNKVVLGWGHSFKFCNDYQIMEEMDKKIQNKFLVYIRKVLSNLRSDYDGNPHLLLGLNSLEFISKSYKTEDLIDYSIADTVMEKQKPKTN